MNIQDNIENKVKLSVVIPCYNMGDFVKEAIESVLEYDNQEQIEIIVINDGSNDNGYTKTILDNYNLFNLRVIHQNNYGLGKARNVGVNTSKSDYILFLDADNKVRPNYIKKSIKILDSNNNISVVYGNVRRFGLENKNVVIGSFDLARITIKNYIDACVVIRKNSFLSLNGYDESMPVMGYEDWDLNLRLAYSGYHFFYIDDICFDYRVRENSMLVNSNDNRQLLLNYMFNKTELLQVGIIRKRLIENSKNKSELDNIKNRFIIKHALKLEHFIKKFLR